MTFIEYILLVIMIAAPLFVAYKMKRDSSDTLRDHMKMLRERQRAIKGDYTKKD